MVIQRMESTEPWATPWRGSESWAIPWPGRWASASHFCADSRVVSVALRSSSAASAAKARKSDASGGGLLGGLGLGGLQMPNPLSSLSGLFGGGGGGNNASECLAFGGRPKTKPADGAEQSDGAVPVA